VLALAENCILHHDFMKASSSLLHPCASVRKGCPKIPFVFHHISLLWPCGIFIASSLLLLALEMTLQSDILS
jgi:hypothetical protein